MEKKKIPKNGSGEISRREFLRDAGLVVGGAAIGSTVLLAACGGEETTKTVTETATQTQTVTTTAGEVTKTATVTQTVSTFVCPICNQEFDTLSALKSHFETAHPGEAPAAAALNVVKFTVNGETHELYVQPNWTLSFVLREKLELTGTKIGCDTGACGACTVLMDGLAVPSCKVLAIEADGKDIVTIEGLWKGEEPHPLINAFVEHFGFQCGFCAPGVILSAKALLDKNPHPPEGEIRQALSGNLCRCGSYDKMVESVQAAAGI